MQGLEDRVTFGRESPLWEGRFCHFLKKVRLLEESFKTSGVNWLLRLRADVHADIEVGSQQENPPELMTQLRYSLHKAVSQIHAL